MFETARADITPRVWAYAGVAFFVSLAAMLAEVSRTWLAGAAPLVVYAVLLLLAFAAGLYRIAPEAALGLVWVAWIMQALGGTPLLASQVCVGIVAYGTARYGATWVVWVSLASIPAALAAAVVWWHSATVWASDLLMIFIDRGRAGMSMSVVATAALMPLLVPWVVGLLLRLRDSARRSDRAMEQALRDEETARTAAGQAQQLAELREGQARLARDVHDVVGHSLTVILAQAQSAQYLDPSLHPDVQRALTAIASTARASLAEVRAILASTDSDAPAAHDGTDGGVRREFEGLLEDVQAAGVVVDVTVEGQPRALAPDLSVTLYRALQEMLTNVLKHGSRDAAVRVRFDWRAGLIVAVSNQKAATVDADPAAASAGNTQGLKGMAERMAAVGGTLEVDQQGDTFTVTATFPTAGRPVPGSPTLARTAP